MAGARAAGLRGILVDPDGYHTDKPCDRIACFAELASLLEGAVR